MFEGSGSSDADLTEDIVMKLGGIWEELQRLADISTLQLIIRLSECDLLPAGVQHAEVTRIRSAWLREAVKDMSGRVTE